MVIHSMKKTFPLVLGGLFIALQVVLGDVLAVNVSPSMRINLIFIPIAIGGALFGPLWNGLICMAADVLGFVTAQGQGSFFPGFTVSAFLTGFAYGFFLKSPLPAFIAGALDARTDAGKSAEAGKGADVGKGDAAGARQPAGRLFLEMVRPSPISRLTTMRSLLVRTFLAAFCVTILIEMLLNTYWLSVFLGKAYLVLFLPRIVKSLIMLPIHVAVVTTIWRPIGKYIERYYYAF